MIDKFLTLNMFETLFLITISVLIFTFGSAYGSAHKEYELRESRREQDYWMQANGDCVDCANACLEWTEELPECK